MAAGGQCAPSARDSHKNLAKVGCPLPSCPDNRRRGKPILAVRPSSENLAANARLRSRIHWVRGSKGGRRSGHARRSREQIERELSHPEIIVAVGARQVMSNKRDPDERVDAPRAAHFGWRGDA